MSKTLTIREKLAAWRPPPPIEYEYAPGCKAVFRWSGGANFVSKIVLMDAEAKLARGQVFSVGVERIFKHKARFDDESVLSSIILLAETLVEVDGKPMSDIEIAYLSEVDPVLFFSLAEKAREAVANVADDPDEMEKMALGNSPQEDAPGSSTGHGRPRRRTRPPS